jgi:hypothetical protein
MRVFCDLPVPTTASYLTNNAARLAELEPLLSTAKKELAAALKVTKAA